MTKISVVRPGLIEPAEAAVAQRAGRRQPDREQQDREREDDVHDARKRRIEPAAQEAGQRADDHAEEDGQSGGDEGDLERDAGAVDDAGEDVAPQFVDSERMHRAGPARLAEHVQLVGVGGVERLQVERLDDQRRGQRHHDQRDDEAERRDGHAVLAESPPEQLQRRASRDLAGIRVDEDDLMDFNRVEAHRTVARTARIERSDRPGNDHSLRVAAQLGAAACAAHCRRRSVEFALTRAIAMVVRLRPR